MRLVNEYIDRFRSKDVTPVKEGVNSKDVYVNGYNTEGNKIKVRKEDDYFYDENGIEIDVEIWEYIKEYRYTFYNIKQSKPIFNKKNKYIIGVDNLGNEFLVYQKENKLHMHCNYSEANIIMWRYIDKCREVNLK